MPRRSLRPSIMPPPANHRPMALPKPAGVCTDAAAAAGGLEASSVPLPLAQAEPGPCDGPHEEPHEEAEATLTSLPPEVLSRIVCLLDGRSLARLRGVCRFWYAFVQDNAYFWNRCCLRTFEPWVIRSHLRTATRQHGPEAIGPDFWCWLYQQGEASNEVNCNPKEEAAWAAKAKSVPPHGFVNRSGHTATLLDDHRLLIVGGLTEDPEGRYQATDSILLADLETGDLSVVQSVGDAFICRLRHTTCKLSENRVAVFGGYDLESRMVLHGLQIGTIAADGKSIGWVLQATAGPSPGPRCQHVAGMLPDGHTMLVYGGSPDPDHEPQHVVALDTETWRWRRIACRGLGTVSFVLGMSLIDRVRRRFVLFGGANGDMRIRYLDLDSWEWCVADEQATPMPEGRERSSVVMCGPDSALVLAGGSLDTGAPLDDAWRLRLDTLEWHPVQTRSDLRAAGHTLNGGISFGGYVITQGQLRANVRIRPLSLGAEAYPGLPAEAAA